MSEPTVTMMGRQVVDLFGEHLERKRAALERSVKDEQANENRRRDEYLLKRNRWIDWTAVILLDEAPLWRKIFRCGKEWAQREAESRWPQSPGYQAVLEYSWMRTMCASIEAPNTLAEITQFVAVVRLAKSEIYTFPAAWIGWAHAESES